jgi:hypothetical protein
VIKKRLAVAVLILAGCLLIPSQVFAQDGDDYDPVSANRLRAVLADVKVWTAETIAFRENAKNLEVKELVRQANVIRKKFDPVMVLMATTEPPAEYQLAATMLLMGTKGVELSLWHYILAGVANATNAMTHGDTLLQTAVDQINDAGKLFAK